jgi:tRNA threonylcarbamoyladenosine biosynthesis protein TsaB
VSRLPVGTKVAGAAALLYSEAFASASIDARAPYPKAGVLAELAVLDEWAVPPLPIYLRRPDARPPGPPKPVTAKR